MALERAARILSTILSEKYAQFSFFPLQQDHTVAIEWRHIAELHHNDAAREVTIIWDQARCQRSGVDIPAVVEAFCSRPNGRKPRWGRQVCIPQTDFSQVSDLDCSCASTWRPEDVQEKSFSPATTFIPT